MKPRSHPGEQPAPATQELLHLRERLGTTQTQLTGLLASISAESERRASEPGPDVPATSSAQLLVALLRAQAEAASVAQALDDVVRSARLDDLTGLPNRALMMDRLAQAMAQARRLGTHVGVLFLDLDNFKPINDINGHATGDAVLQGVAVALTEAFRDTDTVSRHGGDEFLVVLPNLVHAAEITVAVEHAAEALRRVSSEMPVSVSASIGYSVFPEDGDDPSDLIECADKAMYAAKQRRAQRNGMHGTPSDIPVVAGDPALIEADPDELQQENAHLQQCLMAAQEARRQQSDFVAVLSHELRYPLGPIRNAASLLERVSPGELPRLKALIEHQVLRLVRLASDLLDISRADVGKLRMEMRRLDLATVLHDVADAARPITDRRDQRLEVIVDAPLHVDGDAIRLEQIFTNLLDNASKFTPVGGRVTLRAHTPGDCVEVTVADSGIGVSDDVLDYVFDPFVKGTDVDTDATFGTGPGIGLTLARQLVRAHSGAISVASAGKGQGSAFTVTLPRAYD